MKKILVYTFNNFSYKKDLLFKDVRILKELNKDIKSFCQEIIINQPSLVIGIAKSANKYSTIEKYTVNKFNKDKKVLINTPYRYKLDIPPNFEKHFKIRTIATTSFCNLTMFKIKHFIEENQLNIPFVFIHITEKDIKYLKNVL